MHMCMYKYTFTYDSICISRGFGIVSLLHLRWQIMLLGTVRISTNPIQAGRDCSLVCCDGLHNNCQVQMTFEFKAVPLQLMFLILTSQCSISILVNQVHRVGKHAKVSGNPKKPSTHSVMDAFSAQLYMIMLHSDMIVGSHALASKKYRPVVSCQNHL